MSPAPEYYRQIELQARLFRLILEHAPGLGCVEIRLLLQMGWRAIADPEQHVRATTDDLTIWCNTSRTHTKAALAVLSDRGYLKLVTASKGGRRKKVYRVLLLDTVPMSTERWNPNWSLFRPVGNSTGHISDQLEPQLVTFPASTGGPTGHFFGQLENSTGHISGQLNPQLVTFPASTPVPLDTEQDQDERDTEHVDSRAHGDLSRQTDIKTDKKVSAILRVHNAKPGDFLPAELRRAGETMQTIMAGCGSTKEAPGKYEVARLLAVAPFPKIQEFLEKLVARPPVKRIEKYGFFPIAALEAIHEISAEDQSKIRIELKLIPKARKSNQQTKSDKRADVQRYLEWRKQYGG